MKQTAAPIPTSGSPALTFSSSPADLTALRAAGLVVHLLCVEGSFSFAAPHARYDVRPRDYVIFTEGALCTGLAWSADCRVELLAFAEATASALVFQSNYGVLGHLSLLANPVIHLSPAEHETCLSDLRRLRLRAAEEGHLFHEELLATLLKAHILDLYDMHARRCRPVSPDSRVAEIMQGFVRLLAEGDFIADRSLEHYADSLCITPHYLSEVSKRASGQPATYWINEFFTRELVRLLSDRSLPLEEVAARLRISSVSYLTRYLKRQLGLTPSALRKGL